MSQAVKYLKIVGDMLSLYQRQLIRLYQKYPQQEPVEFTKMFSTLMVRIKDTQINKCIDDGVSKICQRMQEHLKGGKLIMPQTRYNKTSAEQRRALKSQVGTRLMGMTTGNFRRSQDRKQAIREESEISDIIESYKIQEEIVPRMRMKWKTGNQTGQFQEKDITTIGNNNIHLLSYAIPEIQNSIRRLSFQRSPKSTKERQREVYRTLESRSTKKNYIPRLF